VSVLRPSPPTVFPAPGSRIPLCARASVEIPGNERPFRAGWFWFRRLGPPGKRRFFLWCFRAAGAPAKTSTVPPLSPGGGKKSSSGFWCGPRKRLRSYRWPRGPSPALRYFRLWFVGAGVESVRLGGVDSPGLFPHVDLSPAPSSQSLCPVSTPSGCIPSSRPIPPGLMNLKHFLAHPPGWKSQTKKKKKKKRDRPPCRNHGPPHGGRGAVCRPA